MTVLSDFIILNNKGIPRSLVVSVESGAVVTATNGSNTVTSTSVNGSCTLMLPAAGTWTVSATKNNITSATKTVSVVSTSSVELFFTSTTLNNNTWAIIQSVSDAGQGANYWAVGDRKAVKLNGTVGALTFSNETYYAFIIGFNHNSTYEGTNRIHFQFGKTALTGGTDIAFIDSSYNSTGSTAAFRMNTSNTDAGGWKSSYMRTDICGTSRSNYSGKFIGVLPSDLRTVLKSVTKYTDNTGGSSVTAADVTSTTDYIFLLATYEVFGSTTYTNANESAKQAQYAYYSAGNSKGKYRHSATGSTANWWLRSPQGTYTDRFIFVSVNSAGTGSVSYSQAAYSRGFAPGFCI